MANDAISKSASNILMNGKNSRRAYNKMWSVSARAPVFCKISKRSVPDGKGGQKTKKFYRTTRLIGAHAYNIAASGAGLRAGRVMKQDASVMRLTVEEESSRAPWMPAVSKGAKMLLEQFLCALAQEAAYKAHVVREGAGSSTRINRNHAKLGWEATFESVLGSATLMPRKFVVLPLDQKKSKKKASRDGKKQAPVDDDDEYDLPAEEGSTEDLKPED
jgi:hypothetical protein